MPLHLITGPANAGKAKLVLDAVRARAGEEPILVVPTLFDVHAYQQELARTGAVFGPRVMRFEWLVEELARRTGTRLPRLSDPQRDALLAAAAERAAPVALAEPARAPGFGRALAGLVDELGRAMVTPELLGGALSEWAGGSGRRRAYARDVAALFAAWHDLLGDSGLADEPRLAALGVAALQADPGAWGSTPVFVYGFDDLTELQLAVVRTLDEAGVDVTVALTWEDRAALESRRSAVDALRPRATAHDELAPRGAEYAAAPLHHLERSLFEAGAERADPEGAVALLSAGGERAELELIAAEVLERLKAGVAPEEIAIVFRLPEATAPLAASVLEAYGVPFALDRRVELAHTSLGRAVLAGLRVALLGGDALDLLTWLRAPGWLRKPALADALEVEVRRELLDADSARLWWEKRNKKFPLEALDRLRNARARGPEPLRAALVRELERLFTAPHRGRGSVLSAAELEDVQAYAAAREALEGLGTLAATVPDALAPQALHDALARVEVRVGASATAGGVRLLGPLALRARRFKVLIVGGLQESEFPLTGRPEPFLSDSLRSELRAMTGIPLRLREETLADERALLYQCVSRPTDRLVLSHRITDEEGQPVVRSLFVDDVADCFTELPERRRRVGEIVWADPPTPREEARAAAAREQVAPAPVGPLAGRAVLEDLESLEVLSASQLETWVACPVRWLVEGYLEPETLEPEPEPRARGIAAHGLLERTLGALREETGSARVTPATLARAETLLDEAIEAGRDRLLRLVAPGRRRAAIRRLESDLKRYLKRLAELDSRMEPAHFELGFGFGDAPPADLGDGLRLRGRIDRVDLAPDGRQAAVVDYKGASAPTRKAWREDGKLQVALYMLAAERLLAGEVEVIAGLYQPLGKTLRARGAVLEGSPADVDVVNGDRCTPEELREELEFARARAADAARRLRGGLLESRPAHCHWRDADTCTYPGICRAVAR
jgi:ATP-dependent helicase/DNAse subunit B